jgi:DNA adenine methylase
MMSSYFGSKATSGLCQPIIALMPPHDTYIETHLGGGAIMKRKPAALHSIGIDKNPKSLANFECDYPVEKVNGCAHRFLADYDYRGRELIYSDPPYLHHTRSSGRRYRFDYEEHDHIELLELLKTLPCNVILSGYPSTLYDGLLSGWRSLELQVRNQAGVRTEKLWFNFAPDRVYWPSYAGKNFTDRQRIKRKAANWGKQYQAMPRAERLAVLSAMMAVEAGEPA